MFKSVPTFPTYPTNPNSDNTSDIRSATDYYAYGWEKPGRSFSVDKYAYGMNTQLKDYDYTPGTYSAMFWEYDSRVGQRRETDPAPKSFLSPYNVFSSNPIWKLDIDGNDDYYNLAGKYLGTKGNGTDIRLVEAKSVYDNLSKGPEFSLKVVSGVVKVQDFSQIEVNQVYKQSNVSKVERKAFIILDTKNATLGIVHLPISQGDNTTNCDYSFYPVNNEGGKYSVKDPQGEQVIVGLIHGHLDTKDLRPMGQVQVPGTSNVDKNAAQKTNTPNYAVDQLSIHKVDQNGNENDFIPKNHPILKDALETSGGKTNPAPKPAP